MGLENLLKPWGNVQARPSLSVRNQLLECSHVGVELCPRFVTRAGQPAGAGTAQRLQAASARPKGTQLTLKALILAEMKAAALVLVLGRARFEERETPDPRGHQEGQRGLC